VSRVTGRPSRRIDVLRDRGFRGGRIAPHRAMIGLEVSRWLLVDLLVLPLMFSLACSSDSTRCWRAGAGSSRRCVSRSDCPVSCPHASSKSAPSAWPFPSTPPSHIGRPRLISARDGFSRRCSRERGWCSADGIPTRVFPARACRHSTHRAGLVQFGRPAILVRALAVRGRTTRVRCGDSVAGADLVAGTYFIFDFRCRRSCCWPPCCWCISPYFCRCKPWCMRM